MIVAMYGALGSNAQWSISADVVLPSAYIGLRIGFFLGGD